MAGSVYLSFRAGTELPESSTFPEGKAIPLLRLESEPDDPEPHDYRFAVAIAKPKTDGTSQEKRRNLLLRALLQAIGFEYDTNSAHASNTTGYEFFTLDDPLTKAINAATILDNVPDDIQSAPSDPPVASSPEVRVAFPAADLSVKTGQSGEVSLNLDNFRVDVLGFEFDASPSTPHSLSLGSVGSTNPEFHFTIRLETQYTEETSGWSLPIPDRIGCAFEVAFQEDRGDAATNGFVWWEEQPVVPNNDDWVPAAADPRHHRLSVFHGGIRWVNAESQYLSDEIPEPANTKLCIELYSGIRMQPEPRLPVFVSVQSDTLAVSFPPKDVDPQDVHIALRLGRPCVRITVQGPMMHAPASAGETKWLPIIESVQMKFGYKVEEIEAPLSYTFSLCLPAGVFEQIEKIKFEDFPFDDLELWEPIHKNLKIPDLGRLLDQLEFPLFRFQGVDLPKLKQFLPSLFFRVLRIKDILRLILKEMNLPDFGDFDFSLPDIGSLAKFPGFSVEKIEGFDFTLKKIALDPQIPPIELPTIPGVEKADLGMLKFRLRPAWKAPSVPTIDGFDFRITASMPDLKIEEFIFFDPIRGIRLPAIKVAEIVSPAPFELPLRIKLKAAIDADIDLMGLRIFLKPFGPIFSFRIVKIDGLELSLALEPISIEMWDIDAKVKLPDVRIREFISLKPFVVKLDRLLTDIDLPNVEFRFWRPGLLQLFGIEDIDVDELKFTLGFDLNAPKLPKFDGFDIKFDPLDPPKFNYLVDIFPDVDFPLTKAFFKDLLGDLPSVDFRMGIPDAAFQKLKWKLGELDYLEIEEPELNLPDVAIPDPFRLPIPSLPFNLSLRIPKPDVEPPDFPVLRLWLGIPIDLQSFRLPSFTERPELPNVANRIYFYFPKWDEEEAKASGGAPSIRQQAIDMDFMTLSIPLRENITAPPNHDSHDGYLDIGNREFVIALKVPKSEEVEGDSKPKMLSYFPGGVSDQAVRLGLEGIENRIKFPQNGDKPEDLKNLSRELKRRFQLELKKLEPKDWPEIGSEPFYLRIDANGLTLNAELLKTEVEVDTSGTEGDEQKASTGLIKPFKFAPQEKRSEELRSRVVIIDNGLREASVYATTVVPGTDDLMAMVEVSLKQSQKGKLPDVIASLELERGNDTPIAGFSISLLEIKLKRLEMGLVWYREQRDWDYSLIADGSIGFNGVADVIPDLEGLKVPAIEVVGLDLRKMSLKQIRIPLKLERPVRFEILNGLFAVELGDLELAWEWDGKFPKPRLMACKLAKFSFQEPGALEVHVKVGGLNIEFDPKMKARIRIPSRLGLEVAIGPAARFIGEVGWVDDGIERYFFAGGTVALEGLPEVTALLKFGTGLKFSGERQINMVLFGGMDVDYPLWSGVVVRDLGLGVGLNNRLTAIPPLPSADAVLSKIDTVHPESIDAWSFVREDGFYFSIVGKVVLAQNQGDVSLINSYVAMLVLSIDSNFDIVAVGKLWLSASLKGVRENLNKPALIGALVISPRQQKLEVAVESRPDPFVEENDLIKKLFSAGKIRFSFRLAPGLVDYYLEEVSFRDKMFEVDFVIMGSFRFAIFRNAVLFRSDVAASGTLDRSLRAGPGGFTFFAQVRLAYGYGGLLSLSGVMAYAYLDASATFRVSAWIEIGFSKSFKICGKKITISWSIKFSARAPSLELSLRGNIGLNDQSGGLIGVDCQVGINFVICGYRLQVSGRLAVRPEIYSEVRANVAAFERSLEEYIRNKNSDQSVGAAALEFDEDTSKDASDAIEAALRPLSLAGATESWLRYDSDDTVANHLFLPSNRERWLLPNYAAIEEIEVKDAGKTVTIKSSGNGLSTPDANTISRIEILGLRNVDDQLKLSQLNGTWTLAVAHEDSFTLKVDPDKADPDLTGGPYQLKTDYRGGTWLVSDDPTAESEESVSRQQRDDIAATIGQLPAASGAVERIVLRTGAWRKLTDDPSVDGKFFKLTYENAPGNNKITHGMRILLHKLEETDPNDRKSVFDPGADAKTNTKQIADVTKRVFVFKDDGDNVLRILKEPGENFDENWRLAPAVETSTFWSAINRRTLVRQSAEVFSLGELIENTQSVRVSVDDGASLLETAFPSGTAAVQADYSAYTIVTNPQMETTERHWMPLEDQFRLPDGILSTRFRSLDEGVDEASAGEIAALRAYQKARTQLAQQELHGALDLEDHEQVFESRGQVAQLAINDLTDPEGRYVAQNAPWDAVTFKAICKTATNATAQLLKPFGVPFSQAEADRIIGVYDRYPMIVHQLLSDSDEPVAVVALEYDDGTLSVTFDKASSTPAPNDPLDLEIRDRDFGFGYLAKTKQSLGASQAESGDQVFVRRAGAGAKAVKLRSPEDSQESDFSSAIKCLPIRQEFVVDQESTGPESTEKARVIVKLPLRFESRFLKQNAESISRLQIFRRFAWQAEPVLIRDYVIPENNFVDDPTEIFDFRNALLADDKQNLLVTDLPDNLDLQQARGLVLVLGDSIVKDADGIALNVARIESIQEIEDKGWTISLDRAVTVGDPGEETKIEIVNVYQAGMIVPSPYVMSDEFAIQDRRFSNPDLVTYGMESDKTKVSYSVRIAQSGEAGTDSNGKSVSPDAQWDAVPLHIPEPDSFPKELAISIPVLGLVVSKPFEFQLLTVREEAPELATINGFPLATDDFEIWASEMPLLQTGFYSGDGAEPSTENAVDNSRVSLDDIANDDRLESIDGKFRLQVAPLKELDRETGTDRIVPGTYRIVDAEQFRPGFAYALYIRPASRSMFGLVARLQQFLVRARPTVWDGSVRYRIVEQLERFTSDVVTAVDQNLVKLVRPTEFAVNDLFADGRNAMRMTWRSSSLLDGGVEIVVKDHDDTGLIARQYCEVIEEDVFQESRRDFANGSYWNLSPTSQRERLSTPSTGPTVDEVPSDNKLTEFYVDAEGSDLAKHPLIDLTVSSWEDVLKPELEINGSWIELYRAEGERFGSAAQFLANVSRFRKSPLNLRNPVAERIMDLFPILIRWSFLGLNVDKSTFPWSFLGLNVDKFTFPQSLDLASLTKFRTNAFTLEAAIRKKLAEIDQTDPADMDAETGDSVFLDRATAKQLGGIFLRRFAVADDVVSLRETEKTPSTKLAKASDRFPRAAAWEEILSDTQGFHSVSSALPLTNGLRDTFDNDARTKLANQVNRLFGIFKGIITDKGKFAKVARRAAGMSAFLTELDDHLNPESTFNSKRRQVVKRPHHELVTTEDELGEIKAQQTPLANYLPDDAKIEAPDQLPPVPSPRIEELPLRVGRLLTMDAGGVQVWTANNQDNLAGSPLHRLQNWQWKPSISTTAEKVDLQCVEDMNEPFVLSVGEGRASVWEGLSGRLRRQFQGVKGLRRACFAKTSQGLEVLTIEEIETDKFVIRAWNLDQPEPRATFGIDGVEDTLQFRPTCVSYDPREKLIIVGTESGEVYAWRDLGKGDVDVPLARWLVANPDGSDDAATGSVIDVDFIRLPQGCRVAATRAMSTGSGLAFIDPADRKPLAEQGRPRRWAALDQPVLSMAIDRVDLRIAVGLDNGNAVLFDDSSDNPQSLQELLRVDTEIETLQVGFLRSGAATYLVTAGHKSGEGITEVRNSVDGTFLQSLPTDKVIRVATQLGRAVTSSTSRNVLCLFHLWERMGFALDFAIVDERNQLLRRTDLKSRIDGVIIKLEGETTEIKHTFYRLLPQEPDGDYRPGDKVGYSFAKVARVPDEFHETCQQAGAAFVGTFADFHKDGDNVFKQQLFVREQILPAQAANGFAVCLLSGQAQGQVRKITGFDNGKVTIDAAFFEDDDTVLAPGDDIAIVDLSSIPLKALAKWLVYRNITLPASELVIPAHNETEKQRELTRTILQILHIQELACYLGTTNIESILGDPATDGSKEIESKERRKLDFEAQTERWLTVPAAAGWSHTVWTVPDRRGHRFDTAIRRVSRYEPLVRWWRQRISPVDIPSDVEVISDKPTSTDGKTELVLENSSPDNFPTPLLDDSLQLNVVDGPGAGQRRTISNINDTGPELEISIDDGDPWLDPVTTDSTVKILARSETWALIELPPAHDPSLNEGPQPITVYQYPRPRTIVFSFQIPADGQRALYNQISKIRSGYQGVEENFRYLLADRREEDAQRIDRLVRELRHQGVDDADWPPKPNVRYADVPVGETSRIRLFRHERLVSLPHLPFYYRYRLDVRGLYDMRAANIDVLSDADLLPDDPNLSPLADRPPSRLQSQQGDIRLIGDTAVAEGNCDVDHQTSQATLLIDDATSDAIDNATALGTLRIEVDLGGGDLLQSTVVGWDRATKIIRFKTTIDASVSGAAFKLFHVEFQITLPVVSNRDHLTRDEELHEPFPISIPFHPDGGTGGEEELLAGDLPDFAMDYGLFWRSRAGGKQAELFLQGGWLRLPWSNDFQFPPTFPQTMPVFSVSTGLIIVTGTFWIAGPLAEANLKDVLRELDVLKQVTGEDGELIDGEFSLITGGEEVTVVEPGGTHVIPANTSKTGLPLVEGVKIVQSSGTESTAIRLSVQVDGKNFQFQCTRATVPIAWLEHDDTHENRFQAEFQIRAKNEGQLFDEAGRFFLQSSRDGLPTPVFQFNEKDQP